MSTVARRARAAFSVRRLPVVVAVSQIKSQSGEFRPPEIALSLRCADIGVPCGCHTLTSLRFVGTVLRMSLSPEPVAKTRCRRGFPVRVFCHCLTFGFPICREGSAKPKMGIQFQRLVYRSFSGIEDMWHPLLPKVLRCGLSVLAYVMLCTHTYTYRLIHLNK